MGSKPFLGTYATFREAHPSVKSLRLNGTERGDFSDSYYMTVGREDKIVTYTESNVPGIIPCSNPRCQQGGYDLNHVLPSIIDLRHKTFEADWSCNGHEGTPKGRRKGDPCMNSISFTIELTYKEKNPGSDP